MQLAKNNDPVFIKFCEELDRVQDAIEPRREFLGIRSVEGLDKVTDVLLLRDGKKFIGCISTKPMSSDIMIICRAYVDPRYRGKGLAGKLIDEIERIIAARGAKTAVARILNKNKASLRAFGKKGYVVDDSVSEEVCDIRVYVRKDLS